MTFVPPLAIHLCWFASGAVDPRATAIAVELFELLHRPLADDGVKRPGLEIPTEIGRDLAGLIAQLDAKTEPVAAIRIVIAIVDAGAYADPTARATMQKAAARCAAHPDRDHGETGLELLVPIVVHRPWLGELADRERQFADLTVDLIDDPLRRLRLGSEIAIVCGRAVCGHIAEPTPLRPPVFISYADESQALAQRLARHFNDNTPLQADAAHPARGDALAREVSRRNDEAVVLVIRSNLYSEDLECGLELLAAKRASVPIVTVLDVRDGEVLTSAYGGNHRTLTWGEGRDWDVTVRCAQAWLHDHYFRAYACEALARTGLPCETEVLVRRPELLDLISLRAGNRLIVHPDPPLTEPEVQLLRDARPELRTTTPRTMMGRVLLDRDPQPPLANLEIAFSLSTERELPNVADLVVGTGLTAEHLLDTLNSIVLATLSAGARIAFGGDFRDTGFTKHLAELHRSRRRIGTGAGAQLICFVDHGKRAGDADHTEYEPIEVKLPPELDTLEGTKRLWVWLTAMRGAMAARSNARILIGGKLRPRTEGSENGFHGPWSGFLEEAWGTLEADGAVYLVGGFSGISALLARTLETGVVPTELQEATSAALLATSLADVQAVRAQFPDSPIVRRMLGTDGFLAAIAARWQRFVAGDAQAWRNGLTVDENRRLFASTDRTEITYLIFEGLRRLARNGKQPLQLTLYNGDIATAVADGYAVTVTPNVPQVGASISLDHRLDGELSRTRLLDHDLVTIVNTTGSQLAGGSVLLARIDLPPVGADLQPGAVEELAKRVVERADELGIQSIACAPFGVRLGLDIETSAKAMRRGFEAAHGVSVKKIVMCELDPGQYDKLVDLFDDATPLRASASVRDLSSDKSSAILNVDTLGTGGARQLRATVFASEVRHGVVPLSDVTISALEWDAFAMRSSSFDQTLAAGRALWACLSAPVQDQLRGVGDSLVVLTDELASGLPWEMLVGGDTPLACAAGMVRRVALPNANPYAGRPVRRKATLKILLLADPSLPDAVAEVAEVRRAMTTRPDFVVEELDYATTTVDTLCNRLATETYGVLHFAGHAFFDEANPANSGLLLANSKVFRGDDLGKVVPPQLVVLSACESGRLRNQQGENAAPTPATYSLTEAFLRNGVAALVGTFFTVDSEAAMKFATVAQAQVVAGQPIGVAVRTARKALYDAKSTDWANFMLFGDDTLSL